MSECLICRNTRTNSSQDRLLHNIGILCTCTHCGFDHCTALCGGDTCGDRHHDFRLHEVPAAECLVDEVAKHCFGHTIVSNNTVTHRAIRDNIIRCTSDHFFCFDNDEE